MSFVAQIIGGFAIALWVVSIQNEKREKILLFQFWANVLYMFEYGLLGAISASVMNFVSSIRCLTFYKSNKCNSYLSLIVFSLFVIFFGILTYDGFLSFIPIVITFLYTVSSWVKNPVWNRVTVLFAAIVWIFYNFTVGAYITMVGNILEIISGVVALVRYK